MRELLPHPGTEADLSALLGRDDRGAPHDRPWVMANMVTSIDGAYALSGVSGALSSSADREIFHTLRAAADVILVAAGTSRAEKYRRPTTTEALLTARRAAGLSDAPRLVVVSRSLSIPADQPFLHGDGPDPLVLHPRSSDTSQVPRGVELRAVGSDSVDLRLAMQSLYADGVRLVLCEGGPSLLGQVQALDLLDELFLSVSPVLTGGAVTGILRGAPEHAVPQRLHRLWEDEDSLFLTYRTIRS